MERWRYFESALNDVYYVYGKPLAFTRKNLRMIEEQERVVDTRNQPEGPAPI